MNSRYSLNVIPEGPTPQYLDLTELEFFFPYIHSTNIGTQDRCDRLFFFEHRLGLRNRAYRPALAIGNVFHQVCETLYTTGEVDIQPMIDEWHKIYEAEADKYGLLPNGDFVEEKKEAIVSDFQKAEAMARALYEMYPLDLEDEWELASLEELVDVDLTVDGHDLGVPLRGRLDKVLRSRVTGGLWILDYKTEGMDVKTRCETFSFDSQVRLYRILLAARYPEERIEGAIHYVVKKPTIRLCGKDQWKFENYLKRVKDWYKEQQDNADSPAVAISKVRFNEHEFGEEFAGKLHKTAALSAIPDQMHPDNGNRCVDVRYFPKNDQACRGKFGVCPFISLCRSAVGAWPEEIKRRFQQLDRDAEEDAKYGNTQSQDNE